MVGVPPAPLALDTIDATLTDHGTSDRYELLAHRASWVSYVAASVPPDAYVVYDPDTPGILAATPAGYWASRPDQGPDLAPSPSGQLAWAPVVPQDSHFTLNFAHPAFDLADFQGSAETVPADIVKVGYPTDLVGSDDMSNIALTPPVIPWSIQHALMEVALYQWDGQGWQLVARQEIAERLWSSEVFVDTEHGINTAIRKLRHLLRDDPNDPHFIQTVTGMGYRFVAPVSAA